MTANTAAASGRGRQRTHGAGGSVAGGGIVGSPGTLPEEYDVDPSLAGVHLRGQIFRTGISLGFALSFLIGGFTLAYGVEELTAVVIALSSFGVIVVLSFFAEVIIEPSLERVATAREEERMEAERDIMPTTGGIMTASLALTGGSRPSNGMAGTLPPLAGGGAAGRSGTKGHALDITLPEEHAAPPPRAAAGVVGGNRPAARPTAAVAAAPPAAGAAGAGQSSEASQDLASLLREASQPSPVAVRSR